MSKVDAMYTHEGAKLIFLANPRTASTSVAKALMEIGFERKGTHHSGGHRDGFLRFATTRNHWDAALSWVLAHNFPMSIDSLERAMNNEYISENEMWSFHDPEVVIYYESIEDELGCILSTVGLPTVKLPWENVSANRKGRHYREFYTDETRDYIYNRFREEIERLGYEFW